MRAGMRCVITQGALGQHNMLIKRGRNGGWKYYDYEYEKYSRWSIG